MTQSRKEKILITAALPYANGPLHFGHIAGAYLPADVYARFQRLKGKRVLFISGSDEYGIAITLSAELSKRSPKEHVDLFHKINKELFDRLNISFDHYSRTTWSGHTETTIKFFKDLLENGYIEKKVTNQLYSEQEKRFLADRYVEGTCPKCGFDKARGDECTACGASYEATDLKNPRSKLTQSSLILKPTLHWFLRFDLFKDRLKEWILQKNWKTNVLNFAKNYIDDLQPRAITRDGSWGIPVPLDEAQGKVFYVWFDAPIGYISATQEWAEKIGQKEIWEEFWQDEKTKYVQFIGKDNIPFHAVFFPAMIMGQNAPLKLVDELPANEFFNYEGKAFSKSEGWTIDLGSFFKKFTNDQIRYALAANAPENHDSEFTWKDFQMRCNSELLGKYGNFVNRVLVFAKNHTFQEVPTPNHLAAEDSAFLAKCNLIAKEIDEAYSHFHLRKASQLIMDLATVGNVYFDAKQPWVLAKEEKTRQEMYNVIFCCLEAIRVMALISFPIIPEAAKKVWALLGITGQLDELSWDELLLKPIVSEQKLATPTILFTRVEDAMIEEEIAKLSKNSSSIDEKKLPTPLKEQISFDEIQKIDLRVAEILEAERIPKSKKLLKLLVDLGFEKRTIVAGIGEKIENIDTLIGKRIAVVANLKPAKLMGVESQGMVLAASFQDGLELPQFQFAKPGDPIA